MIPSPSCDNCTRTAVEKCDGCGEYLCDVCPCRCDEDAGCNPNDESEG